MSDSAIADILEAIDPEDYLVELGVDFRVTSGRSGTQLNVRTCPRCGGSSWKVFLNAETGLGNCFHGSCSGEPGFNLFTFAQHQSGLDSKETFAELKSFAKASGWKPKKAKTSVATPVPTDVRLPTSIPLREGNALPYLVARGFSGEWQEYFEWRYCAYGEYLYTNHEGEARSQDYSSRVIIPVRNIDGEIVTFQGRDTTGTKENKYLFPPQLPGTGKYLYNAHRALRSRTIVIGEGVMDVAAITVALRKYGRTSISAVGSFGLAISGNPLVKGDDQYSDLMQLKAAGAKNIIFMWDASQSALLAACKEALRVRALGFSVSIAILPLEKDPNEVSPEVVIDRIDRALPATPPNLAKIKMKAMMLRKR